MRAVGSVRMISCVSEPTSTARIGEPQLLGALDLSMAPDTAGIYAWYARLGLAEHDWKPQVRGGADHAGAYLTKAVADYARVHQPSPIHLKGEAPYRLHWSGTLQRRSVGGQDGSPGPATSLAARLGDLVDVPAVRQLLIGLLHTATPVFANPLYIGVSTNLRLRLEEHMEAYEVTYAETKSDPSSAQRLQFEGRSFGARLAATGLRLEYLQCYVLPVELDVADTVSSVVDISAREVAEAAEWILQRIFLPVLGRQ